MSLVAQSMRHKIGSLILLKLSSKINNIYQEKEKAKGKGKVNKRKRELLLSMKKMRWSIGNMLLHSRIQPVNGTLLSDCITLADKTLILSEPGLQRRVNYLSIYRADCSANSLARYVATCWLEDRRSFVQLGACRLSGTNEEASSLAKRLVCLP